MLVVIPSLTPEDPGGTRDDSGPALSSKPKQGRLTGGVPGRWTTTRAPG